MDIESKRAKQRDATRRYRERLKAAGKPTRPPLTEEEKTRQRLYMRRARAEAKASGKTLACDLWAAENPEKQRARVREWRLKNLEYKRAIDRDLQAERRSTHWGRINNNMVAILHYGVRRAVDAPSKYTIPLGYTWRDLRSHLEAQFTPAMNWDNWGDVWELDHIKPVSLFKYTSLDDPLFKEAWALSNLRPLLREENATKGAKF
jgi:hypothetical protein